MGEELDVYYFFCSIPDKNPAVVKDMACLLTCQIYIEMSFIFMSRYLLPSNTSQFLPGEKTIGDFNA